MEEIKGQIRRESGRAVQLSLDAKKAFESQNWEQGKALMKEAVTASGKCQKLIKQLQDSSEINRIRS